MDVRAKSGLMSYFKNVHNSSPDGGPKIPNRFLTIRKEYAMQDKYDHIVLKIQELYAIVSELEENFPGRHFTPDGHLVGSIGEVLAARYYQLNLLKASSETHDAITDTGKLVQIKATQGNSIGLSSEPDHLIVLKIFKNGKAEEVYNGPGKLAWEACGKMQKNGHRPITVSKLCKLMESIPLQERLNKIY